MPTPKRKLTFALRMPWLMSAAMLTTLATVAGCELSDSIQDGFYGGISDLISNILNIAVLGQ